MSIHTSISSAPKGATDTVTREGVCNLQEKQQTAGRDSVGDFRQTEKPTEKGADGQCPNPAVSRRIQVFYAASKTCPQDWSGVMAQKTSIQRQIYKPSVEISGKAIPKHQYRTHQYL